MIKRGYRLGSLLQISLGQLEVFGLYRWYPYFRDGFVHFEPCIVPYFGRVLSRSSTIISL